MKNEDFERLVKSVKQAGKIRRGEMKAGRVIQFLPADVRAIRLRLGKSQSEFALMIGVSVSTLQNWEQGRRTPVGPAIDRKNYNSRQAKNQGKRQNLTKSDQILFENRIFESYCVNLSIKC